MEGHGGSQWRLEIEPWRVCRLVVADLHHFDEEQDPDPGQNQSLIWIRLKVKTGIRIHINVLRMHNSENLCERKGKKNQHVWSKFTPSKITPGTHFWMTG
jgi:hypothetical protein